MSIPCLAELNRCNVWQKSFSLRVSLYVCFSIISSMWVNVPEKPWWSIETFGTIIIALGERGDGKLSCELKKRLSKFLMTIVFLLIVFPSPRSTDVCCVVFILHWIVLTYTCNVVLLCLLTTKDVHASQVYLYTFVRLPGFDV